MMFEVGEWMEDPMLSGSSGARTDSWFGPYRLGRLLGRGGFGEVYEATDTDKGRVVALKLIADEYSQDETFRQRLFREASAAGQLHEPHVVPVHGYGEIDGQLYIDMRLVDGTDLEKLLTRGGALAPGRAAWVVRQIASALDAAHGAGLVHRDIKPGNILLTGEDFAYLVDFGLANAASETKLTGTGTTIGTLAYMAPERFTQPAAVDHRADVYALACVLFECLTGLQPYSGAGDLPALMGAHLNAPIPRPSRYGPHIPAGLDEVIARGMAKDPAVRYRSAGELAAAAQHGLTGPGSGAADTVLAAAQAAAPLVAPPVRRRGGRRAWVGGAAAAVIVATAGVVGVVGLTHRGSSGIDQNGTAQQASPVSVPTEAPRQTVLPFTDLEYPRGVAVDATGTVYVADISSVEKLTPGSMPIKLPVPVDGVFQPRGVAVDAEGSVYVVSTTRFRAALKLAPGTSSWTELPFKDLWSPQSVTVDAAGAVYVGDSATLATTHELTGRVVKIGVGSQEQVVLRSEGGFDAAGLAAHPAGGVIVADTSHLRVVRLEEGSNSLTVLPFTGLLRPEGVAVDRAGNIFVSDSVGNRVFKLSAGSSTPIALPFTDLLSPQGVAVDAQGNVYVVSGGNHRVLKLAAG